MVLLHPMENPFVINMALALVALHPAVVAAAAEDVAEMKDLQEFRCWFATLHQILRPKICKEPSVILVMSAMCTFHETFIPNNPRDLPLLNMLLPKWQGKLEMKWIGLLSREENWKSSLPKSVERRLLK